MSLKSYTETIKLDFPVQLADRILEEITMKRPTMKDLKQYRIKGESDVDGEMNLFCALTGLRMEEMEGLDAADYAQLQNVYIRFRTSPKSNGDKASSADFGKDD